MTLTQRITLVLQQRTLMHRQHQQAQRQVQHHLSRHSTSSARATLWRDGKRV